jgi:hypothetical protein
MFSLSKIKQLNIFEQKSELEYMITKQSVGFIKLLAENFDINTFIPSSFKEHYYAKATNKENFNPYAAAYKSIYSS